MGGLQSDGGFGVIAGRHGAPFANIIGEAESMRRVFDQLTRVAPSDASVLITGETGTGKELLARAVHTLSPRKKARFVGVNLSAVPESLIESELFGHEKGAFTGAQVSRQGWLEAADGGTLFLDEVGDLSLAVQVKLLRVIEERTFERVGSTQRRQTSFRLVCATHRNLEKRVAEGSFREDLYYRINVVRIELPPLRERGDDIIALAEHFLEELGERHGVPGLTLSAAARERLLRHNWPGNVRELRHVIERAVAMSRPGAAVDQEILWNRAPRVSFREKLDRSFEEGRGLREVLADIERTMLVETLERYGGNQVATAKKLKIPRQTLQNRMKKYGL